MTEDEPRINIYMDYESAIKHLIETRDRLEETTKKLKDLSERHDDLTGQHEDLRERYFQLKQCTLNGLWGYAIENSSDFEEIIGVDQNLIETKNRVGDFYLGSVLGTGHFSEVRELYTSSPATRAQPRRGKAKKLEDQMAVKIIRKEQVSSIDGILSYENEVRTLKEVSAHRNIVDFVGVLHGPQNLYIIMEGFKHDLFNFREQFKDKIDANITGLLLKEVMNGVAHLAQHNMVHRDIKPENVLVHVTTNDITVKLCDFGLCKKLGDKVTKMSRDFVGSPGFFAPEIVTTSVYDPYKADIFSVGCTALEMLVSVDYFTKKWMVAYQTLKDPKEKGNFYFHIREALLTAQDEISRRFSGSADACVRDFVCSILHMQPSLRPPVTDLLRTKWMNKADKARACDILLDRDQLYLRQRRFSYIPPRRLTQEEIDAEFAKKTLLPTGVRVPESKLPSIVTNATDHHQRRQSTFKAVQQLEQQNRRISNASLKDNGLGVLALDNKERRRVSQSRRASFLVVESEQKVSQSETHYDTSCDPSHVPFATVNRQPSPLGALSIAMKEAVPSHDDEYDGGKDDNGEGGDDKVDQAPIEITTWDQHVVIEVGVEANGDNDDGGDDQLVTTVERKADLAEEEEPPRQDTRPFQGDFRPSEDRNDAIESLQFPMDLELRIEEGTEGETDLEDSSADSSPAVSRKPSFHSPA